MGHLATITVRVIYRAHMLHPIIYYVYCTEFNSGFVSTTRSSASLRKNIRSNSSNDRSFVSGTTDLLKELLTLITQVRTLSVEMLQIENHGNLTIGAKGKDVWALQIFLITNNILAPMGPRAAKLANPTSYFGYITEGSLSEYQASVNIAPPAGYFGSKTRNFIFSQFLPNGPSSVVPPAVREL
jgi:peptidoglycan hydrolase-like protein with peptidoglycan-binding domain